MANKTTATATATKTSTPKKGASAKATRILLRQAKGLIPQLYSEVMGYLDENFDGGNPGLGEIFSPALANEFRQLAERIETQTNRTLPPDQRLAAIQDEIDAHMQLATEGGVDVIKTTEWQQKNQELAARRLSAEKAVAKSKKKAAAQSASK